MNGTKIFADTNVILYFLQGEKEIVEILSEKEIIISFITELELLSFPDLTIASEKIIKNLLLNCTIVNINNHIKSSTINLRKLYHLKLPDAIIAATAMNLNLPILTADKQFGKIDHLEVLLYEF